MPPRPSRRLCSLTIRTNDTATTSNPQWLQSHSFSTTTPKALPAPAKKKTSTSGPPKKGVTVLKIKKKGVQQSTAKPPAAGERKALRKRIVLSNTNALEVPGLQEMGPGTLPHEASIGAVMALPGDIVDSLRAVEAFKPGQGWSFFRRPACLVRRENVELSKIIDSHDGKTTRKIVCGEKGVGKSVFLLQAMAMAFMKGWIVINLPEGTILLLSILRRQVADKFRTRTHCGTYRLRTNSQYDPSSILATNVYRKSPISIPQCQQDASLLSQTHLKARLQFPTRPRNKSSHSRRSRFPRRRSCMANLPTHLERITSSRASACPLLH